ncbi:hypothetical protein B4914_00730 [Yersinia entomophaga]|nr:hypothetical protein B4914_00730 [Yersinia entomophaga]
MKLSRRDFMKANAAVAAAAAAGMTIPTVAKAWWVVQIRLNGTKHLADSVVPAAVYWWGRKMAVSWRRRAIRIHPSTVG